MKTLLRLLVLALVVCMAFAACDSDDDAGSVKVTSVSLAPGTLTLAVGEVQTLTPTVLPANASDKSVWWISSDTRIVTVDENGAVTAVKAGSARVTVHTNDGGYIAVCDITVPNGK